MNKILYALAGMAAMVLAGCANLDYNEASNRDEDWTYNSPINGVKALVYDVYAQVPSEFKDDIYGNGAMIASATDEAEFALSLSPIHKYYNGGWTPSNPFSTTWDRSYRAITQIHMYLERIHKIDLSDYEYDPDYPTMVQQFELFPYELRFLRAFFYFDLVRTYGDVPLVTTTLTNAQANSVERAPAKDVFKFIVNELDAVAEYLPVSYSDIPGQEIGRENMPSGSYNYHNENYYYVASLIPADIDYGPAAYATWSTPTVFSPNGCGSNGPVAYGTAESVLASARKKIDTPQTSQTSKTSR